MSVLAETGLDPAFWSDVDRHVIRSAPSWVPTLVERAEGSLLYTSDGRELIDFTSGQMSAILGHSHPAITATVREAAGTLVHLFSGMLSRPVVDLSRRLAESLPDPLNKVQLLTTGSESNEAALRLAKLVTGGHEVVAFSRSWHGMTHGSASATYSAGRKGYGPAGPGNFVLPTPDTVPARHRDRRRRARLAPPARPRLPAHRRPVHGRARGLHRRADPVQRRRPRPAPGLPRPRCASTATRAGCC